MERDARHLLRSPVRLERFPAEGRAQTVAHAARIRRGHEGRPPLAPRATGTPREVGAKERSVLS